MIELLIGLVVGSVVVYFLMLPREQRIQDRAAKFLDQRDAARTALAQARVDPLTGSSFTQQHRKRAFVPDIAAKVRLQQAARQNGEQP